MTRKRKKILRAQRILRDAGWPIKTDAKKGPVTRNAIRNFKQGYAFYPGFGLYNSSLGPITMRRLNKVYRKNGKCSKNFYFREFKSKGNGWIRVRKELVRGLEAYRRLIRHPVEIVSGYRDSEHNDSVGGAEYSEHVDGTAADLKPVARSKAVIKLRRFSGIGIQSGSGLVRHVDVRGIPRGDDNFTGGTKRNPTLWYY